MSVEDDLAALPLQPITCLRNMMQKIWSHLNAASNLIGYVLLTAALHSMEDEVPVLLHLAVRKHRHTDPWTNQGPDACIVDRVQTFGAIQSTGISHMSSVTCQV